MQATQAVKGAQGILGTTWDETWHILRRAVARGKARKAAQPMPRIGIDEKAFRKGQNYMTLLYELDRSTVGAISDGNDSESGNARFSQLSKQQLNSVEAIAMDMSAAFVRSVKENIPLVTCLSRNWTSLDLGVAFPISRRIPHDVSEAEASLRP